jgi:hypothetical protein
VPRRHARAPAGPRRPRPTRRPRFLCPRPCANRGPASRRLPSPEAPRTAPPLHRTRAVRTVDRRSVHGTGRTRVGRGAVARWNHRHHPAVTPSLCAIKGHRSFPVQPHPHRHSPLLAAPLPPPERCLLRPSLHNPRP